MPAPLRFCKAWNLSASAPVLTSAAPPTTACPTSYNTTEQRPYTHPGAPSTSEDVFPALQLRVVCLLVDGLPQPGHPQQPVKRARVPRTATHLPLRWCPEIVRGPPQQETQHPDGAADATREKSRSQ